MNVYRRVLLSGINKGQIRHLDALDTWKMAFQSPKVERLKVLHERSSKADMPPTKGEATRTELLKTAEAVFGTQGFYKASVADITRR